MDPISAYFTGISSTLGRSVIVLLAMIAGAVTSGMDTWLVAIYPIMVLWWLGYGSAAIIGFLSLMGTFLFAYSYLQDWYSKGSIFGVYFCTVVLFLPLRFGPDGEILSTVMIGAGVTTLYWVGPPLLGRFVQARAD